jgi:hypothetical protein
MDLGAKDSESSIRDFLDALAVVVTGATTHDKLARNVMVEACTLNLQFLHRKPALLSLLRTSADLGAEIIGHPDLECGLRGIGNALAVARPNASRSAQDATRCSGRTFLDRTAIPSRGSVDLAKITIVLDARSAATLSNGDVEDCSASVWRRVLQPPHGELSGSRLPDLWLPGLSSSQISTLQMSALFPPCINLSLPFIPSHQTSRHKELTSESHHSNHARRVLPECLRRPTLLRRHSPTQRQDCVRSPHHPEAKLAAIRGAAQRAQSMFTLAKDSRGTN